MKIEYQVYSTEKKTNKMVLILVAINVESSKCPVILSDTLENRDVMLFALDSVSAKRVIRFSHRLWSSRAHYYEM